MTETNISLEFEDATVHGKLHKDILVELEGVAVDAETSELDICFAYCTRVYSYDLNKDLTVTTALLDASFSERVANELGKYEEKYFENGEYELDCKAYNS